MRFARVRAHQALRAATLPRACMGPRIASSHARADTHAASCARAPARRTWRFSLRTRGSATAGRRSPSCCRGGARAPASAIRCRKCPDSARTPRRATRSTDNAIKNHWNSSMKRRAGSPLAAARARSGGAAATPGSSAAAAVAVVAMPTASGGGGGAGSAGAGSVGGGSGGRSPRVGTKRRAPTSVEGGAAGVGAKVRARAGANLAWPRVLSHTLRGSRVFRPRARSRSVGGPRTRRWARAVPWASPPPPSRRSRAAAALPRGSSSSAAAAAAPAAGTCRVTPSTRAGYVRARRDRSEQAAVRVRVSRGTQSTCSRSWTRIS